MKITGIEPIPVRIPFHDPFKIAAPFEQSRNHIDCLIIKIHTDEGVFGIGETQAWRRQGATEVLLNLVRIMKEIYEPLMIGKSPFQIDEIMHTINSALYNSLYPQAAVSDALYDLVGKILNVPVYQLLGGKCRDKVRVGICVSIFDEPGAALQDAQKFYEEGYRHIRFKIGIDPEADARNAKAFRGYFGDRISLRADANAGMNYPEALRLMKKLEPYDFESVEQLISLWDIKGMADLCRHTSIPISADESVCTIHSLIEIVRERAASVVQTKSAKNGGIYYTRKLWAICEAAGIRIFPGNHPTTSLSVAAVTHMCAAWAGPMMVGDYHNGLAVMLSDDIVTNPIKAKDGYIAVPDSPGLGMELDEEKLNLYRMDR